MATRQWTTRTAALGLGLAAAALALPSAPALATGPTTYYVSPSGSDSNDCLTAATACKTIGAAVTKTSSGDIVEVEAGTYTETVTISAHAVNLVGAGTSDAPVVVDATGLTNGIVLTGSGAAGSTVTGFTVDNAQGEGILAQSTSGVTIADNSVVGNDIGNASYPPCQPQGAVPGDCGEGLHLDGVTGSTVRSNTVEYNSGGILLSDEVGPTNGNTVSHNLVEYNTADCGITVAGHNTAAVTTGGVLAPGAGGVFDNTIENNVSDYNGTSGAGAGLVLAAGAPGSAVYENLVLDNTFTGNGMGGVVIHSHSPGQYINGNQITGNSFTANGTLGDPSAGLNATSGVIVYSAAVPVTGTVISGNTFNDSAYGVWTSDAPSALRSNGYSSVTTPVSQTPQAQYELAVTSPKGSVWDYQPSVGFANLGGTALGVPAVAAIPATAPGNQAIPLFVVVGTNHHLYVRNRTAAWRELSTASCLGSPGATVIATSSGGTTTDTLYVACEGTNRALYAGHVVLGTGLPTGLALANLGGILTAGPAVAPVNGASGPVATYFVVGTGGGLYSRADGAAAFSRIAASGCTGGVGAGQSSSGTTVACVAGGAVEVWTDLDRPSGAFTGPVSLGGPAVGVPGVSATIPYFFTESPASRHVMWRDGLTPWASLGGTVVGGVSAVALT